VPACEKCNNEKSSLEHYLTAVMPFGGRHADSTSNLITQVAPRLARNPMLTARLATGMRTTFESGDGVNWQPSGTLPLDSTQLVRLYVLMAKGLAYWHWNVLIPDATCTTFGTFFSSEGETLVGRLFAGRANRVQANLSDGVLVYEAVQDPGHLQFTAWRMSLYGAQVTGDSQQRAEIPSRCYVLTAPRTMQAATEFIESMRRRA